jgi:hypothetical protein
VARVPGWIDERWRTRPCAPLARHGLASLRRIESLTLRCAARTSSSRNCANRRN